MSEQELDPMEGRRPTPTVPSEERPDEKPMHPEIARVMQQVNEAAELGSIKWMIAKDLLIASMTGRQMPTEEKPRVQRVQECVEMAETFLRLRAGSLEKQRMGFQQMIGAAQARIKDAEKADGDEAE